MLTVIIDGMDDPHRLQTTTLLVDKSAGVVELMRCLNHALKPGRDTVIGNKV
jgi:hypothetical protein